MSRSYLKTPITGITCCHSEKQDKRIANRIVRRSVRQQLKFAPCDFTQLDRRGLRFNNVWAFGKDGKSYFGRLVHSERELYFALMRK